MRLKDALIVCGAAVWLAGCFSLEAAKLSRSGDENVLVTNYGWYLFNKFPLATGNANYSKITDSPTVFFRDDVTLDKVQGRMLKYAKDQGKEIHDLTYHNHDSILFNIPGINFPLPIPYVLTYREIQLSGVMSNETNKEGGVQNVEQ